MSAVIQHYQSEFERAEPLLPWRDAKGWQAWRQSAWSRFAEQGFPRQGLAGLAAICLVAFCRTGVSLHAS